MNSTKITATIDYSSNTVGYVDGNGDFQWIQNSQVTPYPIFTSDVDDIKIWQEGDLRLNKETNKVEMYSNGAWTPIADYEAQLVVEEEQEDDGFKLDGAL